MYVKKYSAIILILLLGTILCGFVFDKSEMMLDTEKNIVYQNYSIDKVLADFEADKDAAKDTYAKNKIVLLGKISEISKNYKKVVLVSLNGTQDGMIKCSSSNKEIVTIAKTLSEDDIVKVYGEFSVSLIGNDLGMNVSKIEKATVDSVSDTSYSLLNGTTINATNMYNRTFSKDKITYYIPSNWSKVEYNIKDNDLGSIEGYQYRLNEIPQSESVQPESFFVCYFDNKDLKNSGDKNKTDLIERAIIANILKVRPDSLSKFPIKKTDTYYGAKYQYYQDAYKDAHGKGHHVEFVFQQVETDGIIVYLYVYTDANHVDDIMFLMRLLQVG